MAFLLNIQMEHSDPIIERNVIVPKHATFKQLHDVIQNATNFKSGYPYGGYHMYDFELRDEKIRITEDEESHLEHQHFIDHPEFYKMQLEQANKDHKKFVQAMQENFAITTKYPDEPIQDYLKKGKEIYYNYDYGDGWTFIITLVQFIDKYELNYPILISGANDAPVEDVGGLGGFDDFKEIMSNPKHPEYESLKEWSTYQGFEKFSETKVN